MSRHAVLRLTALAVVLFLAACGGSDPAAATGVTVAVYADGLVTGASITKITLTATPGGVTQDLTYNAATGANLMLFLVQSLDGTNYTSGPTSGTTTTDEPDLTFLGSIPVNTASVTHTKSFSIGAAYGGALGTVETFRISAGALAGRSVLNRIRAVIDLGRGFFQARRVLADRR
mgnify:CR=1 FL=1